MIAGFRMWDTEISSLDQIMKIPSLNFSQTSTTPGKMENKYNELTAGVGIKF